MEEHFKMNEEFDGLIGDEETIKDYISKNQE